MRHPQLYTANGYFVSPRVFLSVFFVLAAAQRFHRGDVVKRFPLSNLICKTDLVFGDAFQNGMRALTRVWFAFPR